MKSCSARVLVEELSLGQNSMLETRILAPHVPPAGVVKSRLQGVLRTFGLIQNNFEGWGIFQPRTQTTLHLVDRAATPLVEGYLGRFPCWEMRLIRHVRGRTWLAQARHNKASGPRGHKDWFNPSDGPLLVHLVEEGRPFAVIRARFDGRNMFYEAPAPTADPRLGFAMLHALEARVRPEDLRLAGMTTLDRCAYSAQFLHVPCHAIAGQFRETVRWTDLRGETQDFALIERDLKIAVAGICFGADNQFDVSSLKGILEKLA